MFLLSILILSVECALAHVQYDMIPPEVLFERFIQDYNKVYKNDQEKKMRFEIFKDTLREINESNRKHGYNVMGINHFADLTNEEFSSKLGFIYEDGQDSACSKGNLKKPLESLPESFDWRDHGVVAEVKYQQKCASCWAFSTISNIESQYAIKHGNVVPFSEQQLVDCDESNHHCQGGGRMDKAILYLKNTGVMAQQDYPFEGVQGQCLFDTRKVIVNITGCTDYSIESANDEETLKAALIENGPLSIALSAFPKNYQGGVFEHCQTGGRIYHALNLVGYGTDQATGKPYWILRNSMSSSWGEGGYLRIVRGNPDCKSVSI